MGESAKTVAEEYISGAGEGECASPKKGEEDSGCRGRRGMYGRWVRGRGGGGVGSQRARPKAFTERRGNGQARGMWVELSYPQAGIFLSRSSREPPSPSALFHALVFDARATETQGPSSIKRSTTKTIPALDRLSTE